MTNSWMILGIVLPMAACAVPLRNDVDHLPVVARLPEVYSRSEIDAMHAESQCKAMARNLVQIARCQRLR